MSTDTAEDKTDKNFLDMSDDDLPDFLEEPMEASADVTSTEDEANESSDDADSADDATTDTTDASDDSDADEQDADDDESESEEDAASEDDDADEGSTDEEDSAATEDEKSDDADTKDEVVESAQTQLDQLYKPFKANGKQMQVDNVDDALTLMKMGANYNKKMAGLKPSLRIIKMLEKNNLLDEGKLSYLIDLDKKDPNAVSKLLKDSGIDPLEVDVSKGKDYRPGTYTVGDEEVELDGVLDDIRDTATFQDTVNIISNKWDEPSKQVLVENPGIISVINDHVANGMYEQITNVIESERMMGRLKGVSDVQAYQLVGDEMKVRGLFDEKPTTPPQKKTKTAADVSKAKSRKKAASPTKSSGGKKVDNDFNPLSLSDAEFEKLADTSFS